MQAYAVIRAGGKQHNVKQGDVIKVETFSGKDEGDSLELPVLAAHNGTELSIGAPELDQKASVTIVGSGRGKKIIVFKKHRRQTYKRKNGHRQNYHSIRIDSIPG